MNFKEQQQAYAQTIEASLDSLLQGEDFVGYPRLLEAMRYGVLGGGKRLRGTLALAFSQLLSEQYASAMPSACALEMFHAYTLIHDDLPCMDNDQLRRGKESCWVKFGEAEALLAGDALLTAAFETVASQPTGLCKRIQLEQIRTLAICGGRNGVIAGQIMDMNAENRPVEYNELKQIHLLKTGRLIEAAVRMGALSADASETDLEISGEYATHFGLQFQIIDDLLDVIGEESTLGKPVGSDSRNQKTTYVTLFGVEKSQKMAQEETKKALQALSKLAGDKIFLENLTQSMLHRVV